VNGAVGGWCERGKKCRIADGLRELNEQHLLESEAESKRSAMPESEMRFAHTRDKILTVVACFLAVAIVVVMQL
jgi:hypothetical protein